MSIYRKVLSVVFSGLFMALLLAACEPITEASDDDVGFDSASIESIVVERVPPGKAGSEDSYLLTLTVSSDVDPAALPDGFSLTGSDGVILRDDGASLDTDAGDRVYSALVPAELVPVDPDEIAAGKREDIKFKCKFELAMPGEEICGRTCEGKSLITKSDVVVCFCITECEIEISF